MLSPYIFSKEYTFGLISLCPVILILGPVALKKRIKGKRKGHQSLGSLPV
jgi:hypothetical protein